MGFLNHVKLWNDVLKPKLDEKAAPSLGEVHLSKEEGAIYSDPVEFLRRTLVTRHMAEALENVADALVGRGGNKLVMLLSLFGGGKTHTLLTIYHAFRNPAALLEAKTEDVETRERLSRLAEELSRMGGVRVVVLDGYFSELAPTPVNPLVVPGGYRVQTIWGSLAHQLGRFGEVRENDEKLLAPPADVLVGLLGNEPVLILVDELVDYVVRLKSSGDSGLQNYADQVLSFVESLAKAVDLSRRSVLMVSMPVEEKGGLRVEERYKPQLDVVTSLYRSISRVASRRIVPVAPSDIPSILKVRIFESIDHGAAKTVSSILARLYEASENKEVFGEDAVRKAHQVEETYPFHPSYIEALEDIVDKHEGLEKTRDAIRITRKVVRKLAEEKSPAELVMPFHINVEDREIGGTLFSYELYEQYATAVKEDVVERTKSYERPELAKTIAKTILVKTFVYGGFIEHHQLYPDKHEVVVSSFEPSMAGALNLQPKDYLDALEWASRNLVYLLSDGGRYWFTHLASPLRRVEIKAKTIEEDKALKKVEEYAWKLLTKPYGDVVSGSRRRGQRKGVVGSPFNTGSSLVLIEPKRVDHDSRDYILVAVLSPIRESEIEEIIYETPSGGSRRYANSVYLIYPRDSSSVSEMLGFAKRLIACDIVSKDLNSRYKDRVIRDVMRKKLEEYWKGMNGVEGKLVMSILNGLNLVAYPSFDEDSRRNTFRLADAPMSDTIIDTAVRALKSIKPQKLYDELDFELLEYILSQVGINLSEGESTRQVSDIVDYFYSNPRLPMVMEETIKDALIDGVRRLSIGVKRSGKIFFKKVYECGSKQDCNPPSVEEGEAPSSLEPSDSIMPWRTAFQEQLEGLKEDREERVAGGIRRIWHAFYIDGNLMPVAEALERLDLETLRYSPLVRITESIKEGVDVKLDNYELTASPGEEVTITILVERVGGFRGDLSLMATGGELSSNTLSVGDERRSATIDWRIKVPEEPGKYDYEVRVAKASGEVLKTSSVTIVVEPRGREAVKGVPQKGTKLSLIEVEVPEFKLKPLGILHSKFSSECEVEEALLELEAEIAGRKPKVALRLNSVTLDDVKNIFLPIAQIYHSSVGRMWYRIRLRPRNGGYITAPEFVGNEAKDVESYMTYYVFEEEG